MKSYLILCCLLLTTAALPAQRTISGTVTEGSPDGEPLIGVSVRLSSDPARGTITDMDGYYSLEVPEGAVELLFSYIGYKPQVLQPGASNTLDVSLKVAAEVLQEVVVTAIGVEKSKKSIGYASQELGGEELVASRETNLVNALSGKVAGVDIVSTSGNPGASANIVIRGRSSITGSNSPLFIIDGIPIDNSYAGSNFSDQSNRAIDINPNDIENITVLKGAAATALYGMRAGNGAIVITTKKGRSDGTTKISFSSELGFDQVNKLPGQQQRYAQGQNGQYIDPQAGSPSSWGPRMDTLRYADDPTYTYSRAGRIVGQSHPLASERRVEPFDNVNQFFRTGTRSNTNLSVSGGNQRANFLLGGSHLLQSGIVPNSEFQRSSVRMAGELRPNERLRVSGGATFTRSGGLRPQRGSNLSGVMLGLMRTPASFNLSNGSEDPLNDPAAFLRPDGSQRSYNVSYDNPWWSVNRNLVQDQVSRIIGNVQVAYELSPGLSLLYRLGLDHYSEERKSYWDGQSGEFRSINGLVINDLYTFSGLSSDLLLNYTRDLNTKWSIDFTAGQSLYDERSYNLLQEGENFIIPGFYDISNTQTLIVDDFLRRQRLLGLFYEMKLGYRNFLYLSVTGRNDWSSTLPAGNNAFFYPSYSLSAVFSEIMNLPNNSAFSYGKLRASYGEVGNAAPGPYLLDTYFRSVGQIQGRTSYLRSSTIGNNDLQPELNQSLEAGLELRFFRNRLGLDFTAYRNTSSGQILPTPVAFASGFTELINNAGEIQNQGLELLLNASPIRKRDWRWDLNLNFARNRSMVLSLAEGIPFFPLPGAGLTSTRNVVIEGQPYGVLFGTRWLRDENGNQLIDDQGYPIMDSENGVVGDPNPDWIGGIRNTLHWKQVSFSFLFDARKGGVIFNGTRGVMMNLGIHEDTENREEQVIIEGIRQSDGAANDVPIRLDQNYYGRYPFAGVSEAGIEDGSFLRLRELNISYSFPTARLVRLPFSDLRLVASARNLLLFTRYSGIDPETNLAGASNSFGRDYFNNPNTRSYGLALFADF
jgi:TonB-linked SusC/RagA family outer membrane protein